MSDITVHVLPVLKDNYCYVLVNIQTLEAAVVDAPEDAPVLNLLVQLGATLKYILNTHHHGDHIGGNAGLVAATGAKVIAPKNEENRISGIDMPVSEGDTIDILGEQALVIETRGHTLGHICFYFAGLFDGGGALFSGDTLFSLGSGRLFEGTAEEMWESLQKIRNLPDSTRVYCGHEYTEKNGRFALSLEPENDDLLAYMTIIKDLRARGLPTLPSFLGTEKALNPFLRVDDTAFQEKALLAGDEVFEMFQDLRNRKDHF